MFTIMLVDDDPMVRGSLGEMLERSGYAVLAAPDGPSALEVLQGEAAIDLMIVDYRMPGMDGLALVKRLRELKVELPVVIMTGYGDLESYLCAGDLDVVRYIAKPVGRRELQQAVSEALSGDRTAKRPQAALSRSPQNVQA